jgi:hypothetical protein
LSVILRQEKNSFLAQVAVQPLLDGPSFELTELFKFNIIYDESMISSKKVGFNIDITVEEL